MSMTRDEIRAALKGPLDTIRTPFKRDGSIDQASVGRMIDLMLDAGCRATILTAGNSHFQCMTTEEIAQLARVAVEHTAGRAMVVAADWNYPTGRAVEFARYCAQIGADVLMVRPPDWDGPAMPTESLVAHFAAIAEHIPVMLVTNIFARFGTDRALESIEVIRDKVPNVVAVKDDLMGTFSQRLCVLVREKWAVFAGGGLAAHLAMHPFGCDGFMTWFLSFRPKIALDYWAAIQAGDMAAAVAVYENIELPLEKHIQTYPGGRNAAMHGLFELCGVAERWRRPPYHSLTDEQMARLREVAEELGLVPG